LDDPELCPVLPGLLFPSSYKRVVKTVYKRFSRIFAHIAHSHGQALVDLECDAHFKFCFTHFMCTVKEFDLVEVSELAPISELIEQCLESHGRHQL